MKNLLYLLAFALPMAFLSCDDDNVDLDPNLLLTGGQEVNQGSDVTITAQASDADNIRTIDLNIPGLFNGSQSFDQSAVAFSQTISIPADQEPGEYEMTFTVTDGAGRTSSATRTLIVNEFVPFSCGDGPVVVTVMVPDNTPADARIYIAGNFQGWDPGATELARDPENPNRFCISVDWTGGEMFKFTRGDWSFVEVDSDCVDISDRAYTADDGAEPEFVVEDWIDICE